MRVSTPSAAGRPRKTLAGAARRAAWLARRTLERRARPGAGIASGPNALRRELPPGRFAVEREPATNALYERLSEQEVTAVEQLIRATPGAWEHYFGIADRATDRGLLLSVGMWIGSEELAERTGLIRAEPPEEVHAMSRGALTAAGALYEADMVINALTAGGGDIGEVRAALDFGCSSGRVLRSLGAAYPGVDWHGCDPNVPAIEWAQANLPLARFFASGAAPPLPLEDSSLDLIYAISIWSHFEPSRGLDWFGEMHRLLRPGGHLVFTTHGLTSVDHYLKAGLRSSEQSHEIERALYRRGAWYAAEFGEKGDWGVTDPGWGTAFLSPEWLLTQLCPRWRVVEFAPGRNQDNQDVYVLQPA